MPDKSEQKKLENSIIPVASIINTSSCTNIERDMNSKEGRKEKWFHKYSFRFIPPQMNCNSLIENFEFEDIKPEIKNEPVIKEENIEVKKELELSEDTIEAIRDSIEFEDVKPNIKLELNNVKDENILNGE